MENNTALVPVNVQELQKIVGEAPAILQKNQTSIANAKKAGDNLFSLIEKDGMSDLYDQELDKFIAKLRITEKNMNEARKPFTQLVDNFKKMFTTAEAEIKPLLEKAQKIRNDHATKKMNEQRERERLAKLQLDQDRERIELKKKVELFLVEQVNKHCAETKERMYKALEESTLDTIEANRKVISDTFVSFPREDFDKLNYSFTPLYLTKDDVQSTILEVKNGVLYESANAEHQNQLNAYKRELIDKIPSKKKELERLAISDAQESEKILLEQEQRRIAEEERIKKQQEEASRNAEETATIKATNDITNAMVTSQAEISFENKPNVKEGYEIILKNAAAYIILAQFWFENDGKGWTSDKIEKMTFARIKKFCEDYASKNDEKINSPFIEYKEIFKAK